MTKPAYTHIISILDTSGSMFGIIHDLVGSFETFCLRQKEVPGEVTCSVYTFSNTVKPVASFVDIIKGTVSLPTSVNGGTALYDAIGFAVTAEGKALANLPEDLRPSKVILTILTDGEENASVEFKGEGGRIRIKDMLEHQQSHYAWEVTFLGANIDAKATGFSLGIHNSIQYTADSDGTKGAYESLTRGVLRSRSTI